METIPNGLKVVFSPTNVCLLRYLFVAHFYVICILHNYIVTLNYFIYDHISIATATVRQGPIS